MIRKGESGQTVVESIFMGLLLLVPLIWTLSVLADLHRGALAATAAAREAGFDAARQNDLPEANRAVEDAVAMAFIDHGLDPSRAEVEWSSGSGLARGGLIEIRVSYRVPILQAPLLGQVAEPSIVVNAGHVTRVDPFRSDE